MKRKHVKKMEEGLLIHCFIKHTKDALCVFIAVVKYHTLFEILQLKLNFIAESVIQNLLHGVAISRAF